VSRTLTDVLIYSRVGLKGGRGGGLQEGGSSSVILKRQLACSRNWRGKQARTNKNTYSRVRTLLTLDRLGKAPIQSVSSMARGGSREVEGGGGRSREVERGRERSRDVEGGRGISVLQIIIVLFNIRSWLCVCAQSAVAENELKPGSLGAMRFHP
jgi:hypothetical protein